MVWGLTERGGTPPRARRRPRPRKSGCFAIRITEQNNCVTIGLFSPQKRRRIEDEGRRRGRVQTSVFDALCSILVGMICVSNMLG